MKLEFLQLGINNFASLTGDHAIDFTERGVGLHFVRGFNRKHPRLGANGVGKSTIFEALCWCLYGRTINGRRNPDIQPWDNDDPSSVSLRFALDAEVHVLTRGTKPNRFLFDGKPQDELKWRLSFEVFGNTILQGQGRPLFFDLTPMQKMDVLSGVLELERWEIRARTAAKLAGEMQAENNAEQGRIEGLRQQYREIKQLHEEACNSFDSWSNDYANRAQELEQQLKQLRKTARLLQGQHDDASLVYDECVTEFGPLQRELKQLNDYLKFATNKKNEVELEYQLAVAERDRLKEQQASLIQEICPTCKQQIRGKVREQQLLELQIKIRKCERGCNPGPLQASVKVVEDLQKQLPILEKKEAEFTERGRAARNTLDSVGPRLAEAKAKTTSYKEQLAVHTQQENPHLEPMQTLRRRRQQLKTELAERKKQLRVKQRKCERVAFWGKGFRDLQLFIIEDLLAELTLCSNAMLEQLGLIGWRITYAVERETKSGTVQRGLTVLIQSPDSKKPTKWECWSGGEALRLRLLGSMALSEVLLGHAGIEPNLEVYDEPAHFLSPEGVRDLVELLADRAQQLQRSIFYIDHQTVESTRFASVVEVTQDRQGVAIT